MIYLAAASRARGLLTLAVLIGAGWVLSLTVWYIERSTGADIDFLYPSIDCIIVVILLTIALRPDYPGRSIYLFIVAILTLQALLRLGLTAYLPAWTLVVLNRLFEIMLLSIMAYAGVRILRIHRPETYRRLFRKGQAERRAIGESLWARLIYNLFVAVHNDDTPDSERIEPIEAPEKGRGLSLAQTVGKPEAGDSRR